MVGLVIDVPSMTIFVTNSLLSVFTVAKHVWSRHRRIITIIRSMVHVNEVISNFIAVHISLATFASYILKSRVVALFFVYVGYVSNHTFTASNGQINQGITGSRCMYSL